MSRFRTSQARDTPVAALVTKSERQPPNIMVVSSISMHPPPTLARGPTGKAVLALEVRSRTLQIAAWHDPTAACAWIYTYIYVHVACPECSCGCRTLFYECLDSFRPMGAAIPCWGSSFVKSELSCYSQGCNKPTLPLVLGGVESGDPEPCGVHSRDPEIVKTPRAPWHVNYPAISSHLPGIEPEDRVRCGMPGLSTSLSPDHGSDAELDVDCGL